MSNSLLEAMSMQLAVIASPVSGTADIVEDGKDGLLIPPDSPEELARSMACVIQDAPLMLRLGQEARVKVTRHFSLDHVAEQYSQLYRSLRRPILGRTIEAAETKRV
jgi:glycosyltransferase involved in cell wall biosynthesis